MRAEIDGRAPSLSPFCASRSSAQREQRDTAYSTVPHELNIPANARHRKKSSRLMLCMTLRVG